MTLNGYGRCKCALSMMLAIAFLLSSPAAGFAQETAGETSEQVEEEASQGSDLGSGLLSGPRWSPEPLTGDWFGARSWLADHGLTIGINLVNTLQGVVEGGTDEDWENGGSLYVESQFDTEKAGLWPGGFVDFRLENQYGDFVNDKAGGMPVVNMVGLFPEPDEDSLVISKLAATQFVAPWLGFTLGRFDTLDGDINNLVSGRGRTGFLNPQLAFSINSALTTPYIVNGVGAMIFTPNPLMDRPALLSLVFADPQVSPTESGFDDDFFDEQYYAAELRVPTKFFGLPGSQNFVFNHNTKEFLRLDKIPKSIATGNRKTTDGTSVLAYNFHQYFYVEPGQDTSSIGYDADQEKLQGAGVFGRVGYADGDVNPFEWAFALGVAGRGIIPKRDDDTFGIAGYYGEISDSISGLSDSLDDDYVGFELYYSVAVTPWLHVTPDFQVADSFVKDVDTAYVFGLRGKIDF